jgi:hypothetical protein
MHLVDPSVDRFEGQIVYLDFDGAKGVEYNGPVTVKDIDVPPFKAPGDLTGREVEIGATVVSILSNIFTDAGVTFALHRPNEGAFSTVYVGGDGSWASQHGTGFLGLAEKLDVGNLDRRDSAFVFPNALGDSWGSLEKWVLRQNLWAEIL